MGTRGRETQDMGTQVWQKYLALANNNNTKSNSVWTNKDMETSQNTVLTLFIWGAGKYISKPRVGIVK